MSENENARSPFFDSVKTVNPELLGFANGGPS
jgi:hypothetical protein